MQIDKVRDRLKKLTDKPYPGVILLDNVSYCNFKCSMCAHADMKRKQGFMDMALYKKIIDEIAVKCPESRIWITYYGEGLILKDLPERIRYAKAKGCKDVVLNSNGSLLNLENSKELIEAGLDALYVGLDAFENETYKKIRVGGDLEVSKKGVLTYKEALQQYGKEGQNLFVQFVVMDINERELDTFKEYWESTGINVKIKPKVSWAGKVEANNLDPDAERLPCYWQLDLMVVTDKGKVPYCACDVDCDFEVGDLNTQSLEEVWKKAMKKWRDIQFNCEWDKLPDFCTKCLDYQGAYSEYHVNQ